MEKIFRLSFANMKKHKKQTILLTLLIVFCMAVTSAAVAGSIDMTGIFPRVADEYAVHKNALYIKEDYYNDSFIRLLREDERVTDIDHVRVLFSTATKYLDNEGEFFVDCISHFQHLSSSYRCPYSKQLQISVPVLIQSRKRHS